MTYGFIILRCVQNAHTNKYWKLSHKCIRKNYPEAHIVIIDDNSKYEFIDDEDGLVRTKIIKSQYPGRGELLPYIYYSANKWFDTACIIHDSVFINRRFEVKTENYTFFWKFEKIHLHDVGHTVKALSVFNDPSLVDYYLQKNWDGCFGGMTIINHDFLSRVNSKYEFAKLVDHIKTRDQRCCFERILACMLQSQAPKRCLLGDIFKYCNWGTTLDKIDHTLPIIKVWTGR